MYVFPLHRVSGCFPLAWKRKRENPGPGAGGRSESVDLSMGGLNHSAYTTSDPPTADLDPVRGLVRDAPGAPGASWSSTVRVPERRRTAP